MGTNVRLASFADMDELENLYDTLNDYLSEHINYPGWRKGIYPTRADALAGISEKSLYVATTDNKIVGSIILRHKPEDAYHQVRWQKELDYEKVFVIYTFLIHPDYFNKGMGKELLCFAEALGKEQGMLALRLDVSEDNLPAIKLYEKCSFHYIDTVDLGLEEYGLKWFKLYEKLI
ncbi:GNAT family N-acetyltransferase [Konateibacter massiliensis]|uniref:GNAT family N-acetyltransferase n=1 Tax=Konateibacter massiliensis TaxID=2002841 RepID=UPI000C15B393|nr:GNAT family N-acetyltransferase [Konateibacter massiliensis]